MLVICVANDSEFWRNFMSGNLTEDYQSTEDNIQRHEHQLDRETNLLQQQTTEAVRNIEEPAPVSAAPSEKQKLRIKQPPKEEVYHDELVNQLYSDDVEFDEGESIFPQKPYAILSIPIVGWLVIIGASLIWEKFPLFFMMNYSVTRGDITDFYTINFLGCMLIAIGLALIVVGIKKIYEEFLC